MKSGELISLAAILIALLAFVAGLIKISFKLRGHKFGFIEFYISFPITIGLTVISTKMIIAIMEHSGGEAAAYERLLYLILLLGIVPINLAIGLFCFASFIACILMSTTFRCFSLMALISITTWMYLNSNKTSNSDKEQTHPQINKLNSKIEGEAYALENNVLTKEDCDNASTNKSFRTGCYSRLQK